MDGIIDYKYIPIRGFQSFTGDDFREEVSGDFASFLSGFECFLRQDSQGHFGHRCEHRNTHNLMPKAFARRKSLIWWK